MPHYPSDYDIIERDTLHAAIEFLSPSKEPLQRRDLPKFGDPGRARNLLSLIIEGMPESSGNVDESCVRDAIGKAIDLATAKTKLCEAELSGEIRKAVHRVILKALARVDEMEGL